MRRANRALDILSNLVECTFFEFSVGSNHLLEELSGSTCVHRTELA